MEDQRSACPPGSGEAAGTTIARVDFSASSEEAVENFIRSTYVDNQVRFLGVGPDARFDATTAEAGEVAVDEVRSTVDYSTVIEPLDYFFFLGVRGGRVEYGDGRQETLVGPGDATVYPIGVDLAFDAFDLDAMILRLPRERMLRTATEIVGVEGTDLRMEGTKPVSAAMARRWTAMMGFAHGTMLDGVGSLPPLLLDEMIRTLAVTGLHTFPNSTMRGDHARRRPATPSERVRRATAFIEANADTAITITEIADAAGVTPRALQYGFRRHLDTTPMLYLRRVRLEHAHNDLRDSDPETGATVGEIARRWGFGNPGRFSVDYREAYGRPPSRTLRF